MRNFLFILTSVFVLVSCSDKQKPTDQSFTVSLKSDTSIVQKDFQTAPRYSCSGKILTMPKLVSVSDKSKLISISFDTTLSATQMAKDGWYHFEKDQKKILKHSLSHLDFFPNWLIDLAKIIFWIAVIGFLLWLLWILFSYLFSRRFDNYRSLNPALVPGTSATTRVFNTTENVVNHQSTQSGQNQSTKERYIDGRAPFLIISGNNNTIGNITIHIGDSNEDGWSFDRNKPTDQQ